MVKSKYSDELIINFVDGYILKHGYAPSLQDIAKGTGASKGTICNRLQDLLNCGELESDSLCGTARAIRSPRIKMIKIEGNRNPKG